MRHAFEKVIIRPVHAGYGLPTVTGIGGAVGFLLMGNGYFISGLIIMALFHVFVSIPLRARFPHGENLLWRLVQKRRSPSDWSGKRRVYSS